MLYHYTCMHSAYSIKADRFVLRPGVTGFLWLTDLDAPDRRGLGLTSHILECDRTEFRFAVPEPVEVERWVDVRKSMPRYLVQELEADPRSMLMHWYLTTHTQRSQPA
jgi:hypothetical protein